MPSPRRMCSSGAAALLACALAAVPLGSAAALELEPGQIEVVAGTGELGTWGDLPGAGDGGPATEAALFDPRALDVAEDGTLYIADGRPDPGYVRAVDPEGVISRVAGTDYTGEEDELRQGPADQVRFTGLEDVAVDGDEVYILEWGDVLAVDSSGVVSQVDFDGAVPGDDRQHAQAIAARDNTLYIGTATGRVLRIEQGAEAEEVPIDGASVDFGEITALDVGPGGELYLIGRASEQDSEWDGGQGFAALAPDGTVLTEITPEDAQSAGATAAGWNHLDVAVDQAGNVYILEPTSGLLRADPDSGELTVLRRGLVGSSLAAGPDGVVYLDSPLDGTVRALDPTALPARDLQPLAPGGGDADAPVPADDWAEAEPGTVTTIVEGGLNQEGGMALDAGGTLYFTAEGDESVRALEPDGTKSALVGDSENDRFIDGLPAQETLLGLPADVLATADGELLVLTSSALRHLDADTTVATIAGGGGIPFSDESVPPAPVPALAADISPLIARGMAMDSAGTVYIAGHFHLLALDPEGNLSVHAGPGAQDPELADLEGFGEIAVDAEDNLYVGRDEVHMISPDGEATMLLDSADVDGSLLVGGLAVDAEGTLFIANYYENQILRRTPDGKVTRIGGPGTPGDIGEGGPALEAEFGEPSDLALDGRGNLYVYDHENSRIRAITAAAEAPGSAARGLFSRLFSLPWPSQMVVLWVAVILFSGAAIAVRNRQMRQRAGSGNTAQHPENPAGG